MLPRSSEKIPLYAAETIASAQISISRLGGSITLFLVLLLGMSLMETSIEPWDRSGGSAVQAAAALTNEHAQIPSQCAPANQQEAFTSNLDGAKHSPAV